MLSKNTSENKKESFTYYSMSVIIMTGILGLHLVFIRFRKFLAQGSEVILFSVEPENNHKLLGFQTLHVPKSDFGLQWLAKSILNDSGTRKYKNSSVQ